MIKRLFFLVFLMLFSLHNFTIASEPPADPILRIETGMHTATIRKISIDAENRYLVTGSDDKTIRVWELSRGRLLKTIRPPIGEGDEGKIYSVAISPDAKTIAAGGSTGYEWHGSNSIYVFNLENDLLITKITGLSTIDHLAYSKDGRFLAAGLANGIIIFHIADTVANDKVVKIVDKVVTQDLAYGGSVYGIDFDINGRLVATSYDGYIRLYDRNFKSIRKVKTKGGKEPYGVSFSPDSSKIAVGFHDSTKVDVYSGKDLSYLYSPDTVGVDNGSLISVTWSYDGKYLYAGGAYENNILEKVIIRRWSGEGKGSYIDLPAADSTIMHILPLKNNGIVFGAGEPSFGIFDASGRKLIHKTPAIADFRGNLEEFLISYDGSIVKFGYEVWGKSPAIFSVIERGLKIDVDTVSKESQILSPSVNSTEDLRITEWQDSYNPKVNGIALKLKPYEFSRSVAISPDGTKLLLGTDWNLYLFDKKGNQIWEVPAPQIAWSVNISGNGKVAVAAFGDGTIRWYRMNDGKEILALFPHNDRKRWIIWTPSGYYDASPGAEDLIVWHINNGNNASADVFPVSKFRNKYYRPDVIAKIFQTLDEGEAIRIANEESGRKTIAVSIKEMLPPVVTIISPHDGEEVSKSEITVRFSIRNPSGEPVTTIKALIDGRPDSTERGIKITGKDESTQEIKITIPESDSEISIIAENRFSASEPATIRVKWKGERKEEFAIKPKLYILAIGVSKYQDKTLTLQYASKDAKDFVEAMKKQKVKLYRDVVVKLLTDEKATKDNILDGLEWLQKETTSKDVAMVFLAGHGVNDQGGNYYFLSVNTDTEKLKRTGVAFSDIKNTVVSLAGKVIMFVDTCHSGNVMGAKRGIADINAVANELASAENGVVVFASSTGRQYSLEDHAWGNGVFTKAVVEGLNGGADYEKKGKITINMLDLYISERVKELTHGKQTPTTTKPQTVPDFPIAVVR